jgi:uncharacterized membrane protein HdeD (DUF308 family)
MESRSMNPDVFAGETESHFRAWVIFAGIFLMVLGIAAIVYNRTSPMGSVFVFGWLLTLAGMMQIVHSFQIRERSRFFISLQEGIFRATIGAFLMVYPRSGTLAITVVLSFYLIATGVLRTLTAFWVRYPSRAWTVVSGVVSVVLGVMLATGWPTSALWFIGFAIGIDLIFSGWALLMLAAAVNQVFRSGRVSA